MRASVIEDDEMTLLIFEWFVDQLCIHTELLSGCGAGEKRKHERKIIKGADEAFHAHERDVNRWQGRDHAGVAFITDNAN